MRMDRLTPDDFVAALAALRGPIEDSNTLLWVTSWAETERFLRDHGIDTQATLEATQRTDPALLLSALQRLRLVIASRGMLDLFGVPDVDTLDRELPLLYGSADSSLRYAMLSSFLAGGAQRDWVIRMQRGDGRIVVVTSRWLIEPAFGKRNYTLVSGVSRTEEERTLAALRESEARYRRVVEDQTEFVVRYRAGGLRTFVNSSYARYFASTPELLVGTSFLPLVAEHDRARIEEKMLTLVPDGLPITDEHEVIRPDGSTAWHQWNDRAVRLEDGSVEYQAVGRDITERMLAERALRAAYEETERARVELEKANTEIQQLQQALQLENRRLRAQVRSARSPGAIVGASEAFTNARQLVDKVAPTDSTVLLFGETGTGKELLARAVHEQSPRADGPLIAVNCAALPETLIASELFGHEKGAFTGATRSHKGRFQLADGGTLFLDEVAELPLAVQANLLRVLQEHEFQPVGSSKTIRVDVRIVAATNRDLLAAARDGSFREDLYYRLSVFPIRVPPLRERADDIPLLAAYFVQKKAGGMGRRPVPTLPDDVLAALVGHDWPGNVRELENVIEGAMIRSDGPRITVADLGPLRVRATAPVSAIGTDLRAVEREHIESVLRACQWRIKGPGNAAEQLGLNPSSLRDRMKRLGIVRPGAA